jgi:hypothetical protein
VFSYSISKIILVLLVHVACVYSNRTSEAGDTLCVRPYIVRIEALDQETKQAEAALLCHQTELESKASGNATNPLKCPIFWDSVTCWPETSVNTTARLPCPNYINKFNMKRKLSFQIFH